jgi:6-phosphofructo-2-kinase
MAVEDFKKRIALYEAQYEPIDDELDKRLSYIKIFNQGESFVINRIQGMLFSYTCFLACVLLLVCREKA